MHLIQKLVSHVQLGHVLVRQEPSIAVGTAVADWVGNKFILYNLQFYCLYLNFVTVMTMASTGAIDPALLLGDPIPTIIKPSLS
jgi:hypothetical protein